MDEDDGDVVRKRLEAEAYGFLPGVAAGHHQEVGALGQGVRVEEVLHLGRAVGQGHHDDERDGPGGRHGAYGVDQHGRAAQRAERLGGAGAEPYAPAGRRDHCGGAVRARFV